jgi:predicted CXXCH cytochrome family protein
MRPYFLTKRSVVGLTLAAVVVLAVVGGVYWGWRSTGSLDKPKPHFDLPPLSASPFANTSPAATYVGIAGCGKCHEAEYRSWRQTAHSQALGDLDPAAEPPDASFVHAASGRTYTIYRQGGRMRHREAVRDDAGKEYATADFPIRYLVGSGRHTRSYLVELDGFLAESPLTWYTSQQTWGMSPGYDRPNHRGFERAADGTCLFCHVGRVTEPDRAYQRLTFAEQPIGCERCHGPGSLHIAQQRALAGAKADEAGEQPTIVDPRQLTRSLREALCAQCHLSVNVAVNVRGRNFTDFRPGLPLSDFCVNYRLDEPGAQMKVVGHVDQLHLSRCYQGSEKLTCTTCHDPHAVSRPEQKHEQYPQVCRNCHADRGCRLERQERLRRNPADDCIACHMPRVGTDIPHIAFTHHRIGIHAPEAPQASTRQPHRFPGLVPFDDVSHFSEIDQERNLGLAYFGLSQRQADPDAVEAYRQRARRLLDNVRSRGLPDGEVAAALALLYRDQAPEAALGLAREALAADKLAPKSRISCLCLTADVGMQSNRLDVARPALEQLTAERRQWEDWLLLGRCRLLAGDLAGALHAFEQAAAIAPFRPDVRNAIAQVHERLGDNMAAQQQRSLAARLASQAGPNR